jgi:hypothetical protein
MPTNPTPKQWAAQDYDQLRLLAINAYTVYLMSISASARDAAPKWRGMFDRLRNPVVGDIVLETSTIWQWARHAVEAGRAQYPHIGVLLRVADEPVVSSDALVEMHRAGDYFIRQGETVDEIPKERVFYIEPLDGSVPEYRWTNANFIAVPRSLYWPEPHR